MRAWGFQYINGPIEGQAWRTRQQAMNWAAQRFVGADDYKNYSVSENWRNIRKRGFRIVRVTLNLE